MIDYSYINNLENTLIKENRHLNMADIERTYENAYNRVIDKACDAFCGYCEQFGNCTWKGIGKCEIKEEFKKSMED